MRFGSSAHCFYTSFWAKPLYEELVYYYFTGVLRAFSGADTFYH